MDFADRVGVCLRWIFLEFFARDRHFRCIFWVGRRVSGFWKFGSINRFFFRYVNKSVCSI